MGIEGRKLFPVSVLFFSLPVSSILFLQFLPDPTPVPLHKTKMSALPKPKLRSLLHGKTKIDFVVALGAAFAVAIGYKYAVMEPRRKRWEEWSKSYNAEADLERMMKAGVFQGVNRAIEEGQMTADYKWIVQEEE